MYYQKNRLKKSEINALPIIRFEGEIVLVDSEESSELAYTALQCETILGIDTETRPAFNKGEVYPVSLIQIATLEKVYIFQLKFSGFKHIQLLLESEHIRKVGLGLNDDLKDLKRSYPNLSSKSIYNLDKIAHQKGIIQTGVRALSARYLGKRVSKSSQVSNWAAKRLSEKQLIYAATDAWICLKIYPKLINDDTDYHHFDDE